MRDDVSACCFGEKGCDVQADMEEGRHVFQEGNAFTLEALQHKVLHHTPLES